MGVFFHEGKKEPGIAGTGWIELKLGKRRLMLLTIKTFDVLLVLLFL